MLVGLLSAQEFNKAKLVEIAEEQELLAKERQGRIKDYLLTHPNEKSIYYDGEFTYAIHDIVNGNPRFIGLHNDQARKTTGVEFVQQDTGLGLPLRGQNMIIGVWDGGLVLNSHQEFAGGRIKNKQGDSYSTHATHVSGTIGAGGVVSQARGMLPETTIHSYYAFSNDLGPMATEAGDGLILSNHSYGYILGWNYNSSTSSWAWYGDESETDTRFGAYTGDSKAIDEIAYNAPKYTIVWSAGNDRSDAGDGSRPADGPYGIIGPKAVSKNIITVGAITGFDEFVSSESAVMSSFSSWGPTKDGRIKPDLVADGVGVYSTSAAGDDQYTTLQGTSMSAPNVTGSLGVIQQYAFDYGNGDYLTSAELKALAIHTARDVGAAPGPDYRFGWGVLNVADAIDVMAHENDKDTVFVYNELKNGETHTFSLFSNGEEPIRATLVWTDPSGEVIGNNSVLPNLVNDLDCRIFDEEGNTELPWVLKKEEPFKSATKGDNVVDNVEQVELKNPQARKYTITVSHKGLLSSQKYALVITGGQFRGDLNNVIYWVGASNNVINNPGNWSSNTGGQTNSETTLESPSLIFDKNGLSAPTTVTLDENLEIENLFLYADNDLTIDLSGNELVVRGQISMETRGLTFKNGTLTLMPTQDQPIDLGFDWTASTNLNIVSSNTHTITSNVNGDQLTLVSGEFAFINRQIVLNEFSIGEECSVVLEENDITINSNFTSTSDNLESKSNTWILEEQSQFQVEDSLQTSDYFVIDGISELTGRITMVKAEVNAECQMNGFLLVDTLDIKGTLSIAEGDTLQIAHVLNLSPGATMSGASAENKSFIQFLNRKKRCYESLNIENLVVLTDGVFNVGTKSTVVSSENVLELNCVDLLFPDFETSEFCANSVIQLVDLSDGVVDSYSWDFGNDLSFGATQPEPITWYSEPGFYEITLTIENENQKESFTKLVEIVDNRLESFELIQTKEGLVASLLKDKYQWFEDGIVIDGEEGRILSDLHNGKTYIAAYLVDDSESCSSRISDAVEYVLSTEGAGVNLYPVPAQGALNVKGVQPNDVIEIWSLAGKIVTKSTVYNTIKQIDIAHLKNGVYIFNIYRNEQLVESKRFIKQ